MPRQTNFVFFKRIEILHKKRVIGLFNFLKKHAISFGISPQQILFPLKPKAPI